MNNLLSMYGSLASVVKSQYFLAQYNVGISESNQMALFEYEAYLNLAMEDRQREINEIKAENAQMSRLSRFSK